MVKRVMEADKSAVLSLTSAEWRRVERGANHLRQTTTSLDPLGNQTTRDRDIIQPPLAPLQPGQHIKHGKVH